MILFAFPPSGVWRIFLLWGRGEHHPARDLNSHLKGFLTSLASMLHCTKKSLTMVSFSFFFPCLLPFSNYHFQNYGGICSIPSIFSCCPFPSLQCFAYKRLDFFHVRFGTFVCLTNLSEIYQCDSSVISLGSGALISVNPFHVCLLKSTFLCEKTPCNLFFFFNPHLALLR